MFLTYTDRNESTNARCSPQTTHTYAVSAVTSLHHRPPKLKG